jgi:hypothetical protein
VYQRTERLRSDTTTATLTNRGFAGARPAAFFAGFLEAFFVTFRAGFFAVFAMRNASGESAEGA